MRWIDKSGPPPPALAEYLANQIPTGVNLDYESFTRKPQLRRELTAQQFGLCAFTGAAIDERMGQLNEEGKLVSAAGVPLKILVHNAHVKPQETCKQEQDAQFLPGALIGEDMDHRNIVAALLVEGAEEEQFGGAAQGNDLLPVKPTDAGCEARFDFKADGTVAGMDADAQTTVDVLDLDHRTLRGWRRVAIEVFVDPEKIETTADLDAVIAAMDTPQGGKLPAYCFAIKQIAVQMKSALAAP